MVNREHTPDRELYVPSEYGHQITGTKVCPRCHCVHHEDHWVLDDARYEVLAQDPKVARMLCPACHKIVGNNLDGIVHIKGSKVAAHKTDMINLLRNEEKKQFNRNPEARIARLDESKDGLEIETTLDTLAVRLGRAVEKAYHGHMDVDFLKGEKFARVTVHLD